MTIFYDKLLVSQPEWRLYTASGLAPIYIGVSVKLPEIFAVLPIKNNGFLAPNLGIRGI